MSRIAYSGLCLLVCIAAIVAVSAAPQYGTAMPAGVSLGQSSPVTIPGQAPGYTRAEFQVTGGMNLTAAEKADVLLAQDYQRLESDLYSAFAIQNPNEPLFGTMGQSAATLVTAGNAVIDRYQLLYPEMNPSGSYVNSQANALYAMLVGSGGGAVTDALRASATSEEYHISDLNGAIDRTSNTDLLFFYNQELAAARNNLRSAVQRLGQYGVTYTPRYLTSDVYSGIIGGQTETVQPLPTEAPNEAVPYSPESGPLQMATPVPTSGSDSGGSSGSAMYSGSHPSVQKPVSVLFQAYQTNTDIPTPQLTDIMLAEDYERMTSDLYSAFTANYPTEPLFGSMAQAAESLATAGGSVLAGNRITDLGRGPAGSYASAEVTGLWSTQYPNPDRPVTGALSSVAVIEENHIVALRNALGRTSDANVQSFYNQGLASAENNLRNAVAELSADGVTYTPRVLTQQAYAAVIQNIPSVTNPGPTPVPTLVPSQGSNLAGVSKPDVGKIVVEFQAIPASPLTSQETTDITYLQESQKLQRDLYSYMVNQNNANPIFAGLSQSADAILSADNAIMARYNLPSPTQNAPGRYTDPKLQNLYIYLTGQSGGTTPDQLETAAMSEELHISDLLTALGHTDNADLRFVYNQELAFSRNNLRVIIPQLAGYGRTYTPQYLSQETFNSIVSSPMEMVPTQ